VTQIFILGASITYGVGGSDGGWADMVKREMHRRQYSKFDESNEHYEVYNFAKPGMTVGDVLGSMSTDIGYRRRDNEKAVIILSVGMNNTKSMNSPEDYVSTDASYKNNLVELLDAAKKVTDKVIFVGYTPVDEKITAPRISPFTGEKTYFSNSRIKEFNDICKTVCEDKGVMHVDIFDKAVSENWNDCLVDGVHPDAGGHEWIFKQLKPVLEKALQA